MGDVSDYHVERYSSSAWGIPVGKSRKFPTTTKQAIKDLMFMVVEVVGGNTNRIVGTKLVVCENTEDNYWVWANSGVTGIAKSVCKVLSPPMSVTDAKEFRNGLLKVRPKK